MGLGFGCGWVLQGGTRNNNAMFSKPDCKKAMVQQLPWGTWSGGITKAWAQSRHFGAQRHGPRALGCPMSEEMDGRIG